MGKKVGQESLKIDVAACHQDYLAGKRKQEKIQTMIRMVYIGERKVLKMIQMNYIIIELFILYTINIYT